MNFLGLLMFHLKYNFLYYLFKSMKKYLSSFGKWGRHLSTRWSLITITLSHACCLPALAGLASFSLPVIQFIGPSFHLLIKIFFISAVALHIITLIWRIINKQISIYHLFFYPILFGTLSIMMYSLREYVDQKIIIICMIILLIITILDMFLKSKNNQHNCCKI